MSKEVEIVDDQRGLNSSAREVAIREDRQVVEHAQERTADEIIARLDKIKEVQKRAMIEGVDYGVIPGTEKKDKNGKDISKPTLLKPGAEKLCVLFNLDAQFTGDGNSEQILTETLPDGTKVRHMIVKRYCTIYSQVNGARLGGASGICSTLESRYAYRKGARACPDCGKPTLIHTKRDAVNWWCNAYNEGCGKNFDATDARITSQQVGRIANVDIADQFNTAVRIAEKRTLVAAVRLVTGGSAIFDEEAPEVEGKHTDDPGDTLHGSEDKKEEGSGGGEPAKRKGRPPKQAETGATGGAAQATAGSSEPEPSLLDQIDKAFAEIEYPDDAKRAEGKTLFLKMFSLPAEGSFADLWKTRKGDIAAKQADALIKIMSGKAESQKKAKEAQG
jgi:hypothetical protein